MPSNGHALAQGVGPARDQVRDERVPKVVRPHLADASLAKHAHRGFDVSIDTLPAERLADAAALDRAQKRVGGLRAHADYAIVKPFGKVIGGLRVEPQRDFARVPALGARRRQRHELTLAAQHDVAHLEQRRFVASKPAAREQPERRELAQRAAGLADSMTLAKVGHHRPYLLDVEDAKSRGIGACTGSLLAHGG